MIPGGSIFDAVLDIENKENKKYFLFSIIILNEINHPEFKLYHILLN